MQTHYENFFYVVLENNILDYLKLLWVYEGTPDVDVVDGAKVLVCDL